MDNLQWCEALREQDGYHQAIAMLKAIDEHKKAIARLESYLSSFGETAELARADRKAARRQLKLARLMQTAAGEQRLAK